MRSLFEIFYFICINTEIDVDFGRWNPTFNRMYKMLSAMDFDHLKSLLTMLDKNDIDKLNSLASLLDENDIQNLKKLLQGLEVDRLIKVISVFNNDQVAVTRWNSIGFEKLQTAGILIINLFMLLSTGVLFKKNKIPYLPYDLPRNLQKVEDIEMGNTELQTLKIDFAKLKVAIEKLKKINQINENQSPGTVKNLESTKK